MYRYEFSWLENGQNNAFAIHGCSEDVAKGVRAGLRKVPSISQLQAKRISEVSEDVSGIDPV